MTNLKVFLILIAFCIFLVLATEGNEKLEANLKPEENEEVQEATKEVIRDPRWLWKHKKHQKIGKKKDHFFSSEEFFGHGGGRDSGEHRGGGHNNGGWNGNSNQHYGNNGYHNKRGGWGNNNGWGR